jgi:hypothetical protein
LPLFVEAAASPKFALEAGHRDPLALSITAVDEMTGRPRLVRCLKPFCPQSSPLFCQKSALLLDFYHYISKGYDLILRGAYVPRLCVRFHDRLYANLPARDTPVLLRPNRRDHTEYFPVAGGQVLNAAAERGIWYRQRRKVIVDLTV